VTAEALVSRETGPARAKRNGRSPLAPEPLARSIVSIDLDQIDIGPNVRVNVEAIDELAESIKAHGVLQPIKVRAAGDRWVVVWGQRRVLAARKAGFERIPAITTLERPTPQKLAAEQLVENLHRADLAPLDRARAMRAVVDSGISQADLARELGLAPSTIANDLGLLEAPAKIQEAIEAGEISPAHARAMKGLAPKTQAELAKVVVRDGLSAHATEVEVQRRRKSSEAEAKRDQQLAAEAATRKTQVEAAIAEDLPKKRVGKDDVIVADYYYSGQEEGKQLAEQLRAAGYTKARIAERYGEIQPRPTGGLCSCSAWKASVRSTGGRYDYDAGRSVGVTYGVTITKACIVPAHQQAKAAAARKAEVERYDLEQKVRAHVKTGALGVVIPATSADTPVLIGVPRLLAEATLWDRLGYRLPVWSEAHGGTRNGAWAAIQALSDEALATELAKEIADDFRDKAGYHIDWPKLAEQLGLIGKPEQPVEPPVDTRPQPEIGDSVVAKDGGPGIVDGTRFRIRSIAPHAVSLAEAGPSWRTADVMALADPGRLEYDKVVGVWRGPVIPTAAPVETPA